MRACHLNLLRTSRLRPLVVCLALVLGIEDGAAAVQTSLSTLSLAIPLSIAPEYPSSTFLVENCNDAGQGSLRDAVNAANVAGIDATIKFDLNTMGCSTITLKTGAIDVTISNLTIQGPDPDDITIDGGYSLGYYNRIFRQTTVSGTLHLDHLVLQDAKYGTSGNQNALGGCVYSSAGTYLSNTRVEGCHVLSTSGSAEGGGVFGRGVKLIRSVVTNCVAMSTLSSSGGGGIRAEGSFHAEDSTVSDNAALSLAPVSDSRGGGLELYGVASFERSTISNNNAGISAGLFSTFPVAMANSTVTDNAATDNWGAMWVQDALSLYNSTIAQNSAGKSVGIAGIKANSIYSVSSLIAKNMTPSGMSDVASGDGQISGSHNLITAADSGTNVPSDTVTDCPRIAPLLSNGGPTHTVAILPSSPAIDVGYDPFSLGTDQRGPGFDRIVGANADIGAYEWSAGSGDEINGTGFESCE